MADARADFEAALPRYAEPTGAELCELCRKAHPRIRDRFRCGKCGRVVCRDEVRSVQGNGLVHRVHAWSDGLAIPKDCGQAAALNQGAMEI